MSLRQRLPKSRIFIVFIIILIISVVSNGLLFFKAGAENMPTLNLDGDIAASKTLNSAFVYRVGSNVSVKNGATLTIPAGTILKYESGPITVHEGGALKVMGTSERPVYFTSFRDDSRGGDSNGDGQASTPGMDDYERAVVVDDGSLHIAFARFSYARTAVNVSQISGSFTIVDSTFVNGRQAIYANSPGATLYRNEFRVSPYNNQGAVELHGVQDISTIPLSGIGQNVFIGNSQASKVIKLRSISLPVGKTWTVVSGSGAIAHFLGRNNINGVMTMGTDTSLVAEGTDNVTLAVGGVMNIQNGSWLKFGWHAGILVLPGAKLNVSGTSVKPVNFTNINDDSVGLNWNNDPTAPDINTFSAIQIQGGEVTVVEADFKYFRQAISGYAETGLLKIADSSFSLSHTAIGLNMPNIALYRNEFDVNPNQYDMAAVTLSGVQDLSTIGLSGIEQNHFSGGSKAKSLLVRQSTLPLGKTWSVAANSDVTLTIQGYQNNIEGTLNMLPDSRLTVTGDPSWMASMTVRGTLNIRAGVIVKFADTLGIAVESGGILNIAGTASKPVSLTSLRDDTIGGDTNNDGNDTVPSLYDYGSAIQINGGSVTIAEANFRYFNNAIHGYAEDGSLRLVDSRFENGGKSVDIFVPKIELYRNYFNTTSRPYDREGVLVRGVKDLSTISLSGSNQNIFTGQDSVARTITVQESTLPLGKAMVISKLSGAILGAQGQKVDIKGTLTFDSDTMLIMRGSPSMNIYGTLNLKPGVVVKAIDSSGIGVFDNGQLNAYGSSSQTIKFTSLYDDTIGGDTNNDGNATLPSAGNYSPIWSVSSGASINLTNASVAYAGTAWNIHSGNITLKKVNVKEVVTGLYMAGGKANLTDITITNAVKGVVVNQGALVFRGKFVNIADRAATACNWNDDSCSVDAAYTDWGGNTPNSSVVCGKVTVAPWKNGAATVEGNTGLFGSSNCDGTATPGVMLSNAAQHYSQRVNLKSIDCNNGFQDACQAMQTAFTCLSGAVDVAASTTPFPLPNSSPTESAQTWGSSVSSSATSYIRAIESPTPQLDAMQFGSSLLGVVGTIVSMANAYNNCAP